MMQSARLCNALGDIKPDGGERKGVTQRGKEKQRRRRVRRYICLADEHRGRKKIIVDKKISPLRNGMTNIAS